MNEGVLNACLFAEMDLKEAEFSNAYNTLFGEKTKDIATLPVEELFHLIQIVAIAERKIFPCRHLLSSSTGYFIFYLRQHQYFQKTLTLHLLLRFSDLSRALRSRDVKTEEKGNLIELFNLQDFQRLFFQFTPKAMAAFERYHQIFPHDPAREQTHVPLLVKIDQADHDVFQDYEKSATLSQILHALTFWKEYGYVSRLCWEHAREEFSHLTTVWLQISCRDGRILRAADLVFEATGSNLSSALCGILLDLALSGPYFSLRPRGWDEVHPSLRLARILAVADRLPKHLKTLDNIHAVSEDYYREVVSRIEAMLEWQSLGETLAETHEAMVRQARACNMSKDDNNLILPPLNALYDRRFQIGIGTRLVNPGVFLFPWTSERSSSVGGLTLPVGRWYEDSIRFATWGDENATVQLMYINDVILTYFSEALLNDNIFSEFSQQGFLNARRLFAMRRTAFSENDVATLGLDKATVFEEFVSMHLNFDYRAYQKKVRQ
jgi:hypothetical protein